MVITHWNQGNSKTIVLFSGYMFGGWTYKRLIPLLSDYHIVVVSALGGGTSQVEGSSHFSAVDYIEKYLSARSITSFILLGHSMGGFVAQLFASRHPGRVTKLILVGTCCPCDFSKSHRSQSLSLLNYLFQLDIEGFFKMTTFSLFNDRFLNETNLCELREDFFLDMPREQACAEQLRATDDLISWMKKNELAVPVKTLVVIGCDDKVVEPEWSLDLARKIGDCDFKMLKNTGHMIMYENPSETYEVISTWLAGEG